MTWRTLAACDGSSVDFFDHNQTEQALAICAGCDVREPCLADALERGDRMGVRGGHSFHSKDRDSCGTPSGYQAHRRAREAICEPCRAAQAQYSKDKRKSATKGKPGRPAEAIEHGTVSGYRKHLRRGEEACEACVAAYRRPPKPIEHGTPRGYKKHWSRGEKACEPCLQAHRQYSRQQRRKAA